MLLSKSNTKACSFDGFHDFDVLKGNGAVQKIVNQRIDAIQGNINSHSKVLNNPERLAVIIEHN